MEKQIYNNNLKINYRIEGVGNSVVLIHGFLETSETWSDFSKELSANYQVISIDLPGHGKSELYDEPFTMCKYAESIYAVLNSENISKTIIIGHSMGGYVALAFAENYPFMQTGLCLFHSSPFADNEEKKKIRLETIEQIKNGNKNIICKNHVKAVYGDDNIDNFKAEIKKGELIAKSISEEGIIASILSMMNRKDRNFVLKECEEPFLYIPGRKDRFIPESIINQLDMPETGRFEILENSGHMGMIEEKEKSLKVIRKFCREIYG